MMRRTFSTLLILVVMTLGLPLIGIVLARKSVAPYLEFPPKTAYVQHAPFSLLAFFCYGIFVLACVTPFVIRSIKGNTLVTAEISFSPRPFPSWGWASTVFGVFAWILAWNRFEWLSMVQAHTFTPLWLAYIVTMNALTYRRSGGCMMLDRPLYFVALFPASAAFWWFFEYLNRFVQNWYYTGADFGAWEYFWFATLPFSTVLPAVLGTREWLLTFSRSWGNFTRLLPVRISHPRVLAYGAILIAGAGLTFIGILPNHLFPLLWISPLLVIVSLQTFLRERHIFSDITRGDWSLFLCSASAALICGFFWEMWNFYSFAKWRYNIPFVHKFQLFEMPILGYAGYLPFGLECAVISDLLFPRDTLLTNRSLRIQVPISKPWT